MPDPKELLRELLSRTCIGAVAQPETGGDLLLHFAEWQQYESPPDPTLLASERGKWTMLLSCPWRLDSPTGVVCDWRSVADPVLEREQAHAKFEGLQVEEIDLKLPANDLEVRFGNGDVLRLLCDSSGIGDDCWYILRPDGSSIAATRDYRLTFEPRSTP
jgi:hypothetical protein